MKNIYKIYYLTPRGVEVIHDTKLYLKYYKSYEQKFILYGSATLFPIVLSYTLMITKVQIPISILLISTLLVLPSICFFRLSSACTKKSEVLSQDLGVSIGLNPHYLITFRKNGQLDEQVIREVLTVLGVLTVYSKDSKTYRLQSPLKKEELITELAKALDISKEDFEVHGVGDLDFMI